MLLEWLTVVLQIAAIVIAIKRRNAEAEELEAVRSAMRKRDEDLKNSFPLWHCQYELPPSRVDDYDLLMCASVTHQFRPRAFAKQRTHTPNCADNIYSVPCYTDISIVNVDQSPSKVSSCVGLNGVWMSDALISSNAKILAARISSKRLIKQVRRDVFSADLIMKCPRCRVTSEYYEIEHENKNMCARQLETIEDGWPSEVQFCDDRERRKFDIDRGVYCSPSTES